LDYSTAGVLFNLLDCLTEECSQILNKKLGRNFDTRGKILSFKSDSVLNAMKKVFNVLLVFFYLRVFVFPVNLILVRIFERIFVALFANKNYCGAFEVPTTFFTGFKFSFESQYRGAVKSLARPGRKKARATKDFDVHISYL
jgi:hypothetical protein